MNTLPSFLRLVVRRLVWWPSENTILLMLAVGVGLATGGGVWLFRSGINFFQDYFQQGLLHNVFAMMGNWAIIPVLAFAGLIVGLLMNRFIGEERHHGVAGIMESSAFAGGRLRYQRMPIKAALASFSLGAGASVGPEDPSVQIGANLGSMFGQWLRLSDDRVRVLVAAGAAGGIAAAFRAPIAGVFFALEVVLGDFSTSAFGVVVLSSVIAAVVTQAIEVQSLVFSTAHATSPELGISTYALGSIQEIPFYILLGIIIAPIAALFIRMLYWQHDLWHHVKFPQPLKTALAGAIVGLFAVFLPQIMGTGRETMNALLNENGANFDVLLLLLLVVVKMLATTVSLGGGFVGGMFAPALFVGAAAGRAYGIALTYLFPNQFSANPAAFAIAGMAASMTGVIRSPITAVLLLFELTNDYNLILPIMLTTAVCLIVVERLAPDGIYHLGLARKGVRLVRGRDIDLMQTILVQDAMSTNVPTVNASIPISALAAIFDQTHTHGLIVVDDEGLLNGIVTLQDIAKGMEHNVIENQTVDSICTHDVITVTDKTPLSMALQKIGQRDLGRIPVVSQENPRQVIGLLRRRDIVRAYDLAMQRKMQAMQQHRNIRLATYSQAQIVELSIKAKSPIAHQTIGAVQWPVGCIVATIRRHNAVIVPRGNTILEVGDVLTVVTSNTSHHELAKLVDTGHSTLS